MPFPRAGAFLIASLAAGLCLAAEPAPAAPAPDKGPEATLGKSSNLPVPRYVSLKTDRVNLREGPSKDHRTLWVFQRAGLPVEIVAEFENWRRIRDSEGTEGWVLHSLLSGRRTAVVLAPKDKAETVPLYAEREGGGGIVAQLQPGVIGSIKSCGGTWCRLIVALPQKRGDVDGYMRQDRLWGVYPNEKVE
ncbi:SH3 domain-containing protein [Methylobacterium sp. JK268]